MSSDGALSTEDRLPLNRERIIDAAVAFADGNGIEELSMRKLGAALDVEAMSLYNHVHNKDEILDGMIDHVFVSIPLPDQSQTWQDWVRLTGVAAMEQFTEHPWVVTLLMQRGNFGPASLAFMDQVLGKLREAGFSDEDNHHAWQMLASHTMGYAFQQLSGRLHQKEWDELARQLARYEGRFPNVAALAPFLVDCEFATEYEFGLEIIIRGLEALLSRV